MLCGGPEDNCVTVLDANTLQEDTVIFNAHGSSRVHTCDFSQFSENFVVTCGGDSVERIWDLRAGVWLLFYGGGSWTVRLFVKDPLHVFGFDSTLPPPLQE